MGTDLFTSHRGAGVIGTLLALIVFGGFSVLYLFVFAEGELGTSIESEIKSDAKKLKRIQQQLTLNQARYNSTKHYRVIQQKLEKEKVKLAEAEKDREQKQGMLVEAQQAVTSATKALQNYKQKYRNSARASMIGREMDLLVTNTGREFKNVKVTDVDPIRMQIRHSNGIIGVPLETLPEDIQEYLQIDQSESESFLVAELENRASIKSNSDMQRMMISIKKLQRQREKESALLKKTESQYQQASDNIPILESKIRSKKSELSQTRFDAKHSGGISNAPQIEGQIRNLEALLARTQKSLPTLQSQIGTHKNKLESIRKEIAEIKSDLDKMANEPKKESATN